MSYLKTGSAAVRGDFNYLINPEHRAYDKIRILKTEGFGFDERLFRDV
jgi:hypothetical protein